VIPIAGRRRVGRRVKKIEEGMRRILAMRAVRVYRILNRRFTKIRVEVILPYNPLYRLASRESPLILLLY